jgi:hypothetical protein
VPTLLVGERDVGEEPANLRGVVVLDSRLESFSCRKPLGELTA